MFHVQVKIEELIFYKFDYDQDMISQESSSFLSYKGDIQFIIYMP